MGRVKVRVRARLRALIQGAAGWCAALAAQGTAWALGGAPGKVWLPEAVTTTAPAIDRLFYIILAITGAVFVLVQGTLLYFVIRYRRRPGVAAGYSHGNFMVEVVWTLIPALILVFLAGYSQRIWARIRGTPPPPDLQIGITGEQFAWNARYAGADGALDTPDDLLTINQVHLPLNQTALLHLSSKDVIHSFFVPQFRVKQDAVPGIVSRLWVVPTKAGNYEIACAELCGLGHYRMRGFLIVEPPEAFQAWLAELQVQQAPVQ